MSNPIEDIEKIGRISTSVTILGKKIEMETLDDDAFCTALSSTAVFDTTTRGQAIKRATLARAIKSVDGIRWNDLIKPEEKDSKNALVVALEKIGKWQKTVVDLFYSEYQKLESSSNKELDEIQSQILKNPKADTLISSTTSTSK